MISFLWIRRGGWLLTWLDLVYRRVNSTHLAGGRSRSTRSTRTASVIAVAESARRLRRGALLNGVTGRVVPEALWYAGEKEVHGSVVLNNSDNPVWGGEPGGLLPYDAWCPRWGCELHGGACLMSLHVNRYGRLY